MIRHFAIYLFLLLMGVNANSQSTSIFTESQVEFKLGMDFYEKELYSLAQSEFEKAALKSRAPSDHQTQVMSKQAEMMYALSSVRMEQPHGEQLVLNFVRENSGTTMANRALYDLGTYFYAKKEYEKASDAFAQIDGPGLSAEQLGELRFKQGYGHFIKQRFAAAKTAFASVRQNSGDHYYPANYYYGMSSFYLKQYKDAVTGFKAASGSKRYASQVPIYIVQIHFVQKEYDEVISYGESALRDASVQKKPEIGQIVGQAYFERGDYSKALPYLNEYADRNSNMSETEFYQVGYANYQAGNCEKAINYFRKSVNSNSEMGQLANYYLGECYIKTGDKPLARSAFSKAASMNFRADIKEDALFNYGKLLVELRADKEAIQTLVQFNSTSKYHTDAQKMIVDILLETPDYEFAISTIEKLNTKSSGINEAYQKATFNKAVDLYDKKQINEALVFFDKSLEYPVDASLKATATFWKAEILHQQKKYELSIREMNQFITMEKAVNLSNPDLIHMANYIQGYNYLKKNEHQTALGFFEKSIEGIKKSSNKVVDPIVRNNVFGDAVLRAGDCHFKRNRYKEANRFYNEAVANKYSGYDYAMFQKALISGLERNNKQKISQLEELVRTQPSSPYADDALYELSFAYEADGDARKSKDALDKLVKDYKNQSNLVNAAYLKLGLLYYNSGDKKNALTSYKNVFQNNPSKEESEAALKAIEEIYVSDLGKPDEYFKFLETIPGYAVRSDAKDSLTYRVAQVQYENGNYDRAITGYTDYLSKYPQGSYALQAYYNRGESHLILKNYTSALKDYESLIAKGQNTYLTRSLEKAAIISYNHSSDFKKALEYYGKLDDVASSSEIKFEAQLGAMRSAYRAGNTKSTITYADKILQNSLSRVEHKATAHYYKGKVHFQSSEWSKSIAAFSEVTKILNNEVAAESNYLIAVSHFNLNSLQNAEAEARKVLEQFAAYNLYVAKSLILLSDIYVVQKDLISARAALEAVIENFDEDQEVLKEAKAKLNKVKELEAKEKSGSKKQDDNEIDFNKFNRN
jgi:tetratricopeptide (TPR) repeat protein